MLCSPQYFTALHTAVWCRYLLQYELKTKIKPTRCTISKQQTWSQFTHYIIQPNTGVQATATVKAPASQAHFFQLLFIHHPSNAEHEVLTFPKAHSSTQAFGDSAQIALSDLECEVMSSRWCYVKKALFLIVLLSIAVKQTQIHRCVRMLQVYSWVAESFWKWGGTSDRQEMYRKFVWF